jgi:hypothetical protein
MLGNSNFESPEISGVEMTYKEPKTNTLVMQPIYLDIPDNEYVNEISISHHADVPELSEINYGVVQGDTLKEEDFFSAMRPVRVGGRTVLLSRSDELMTSSDRKIFTLVNGSWPEGMTIEVYRSSSSGTSLVSPSEYTSSPKDGTISLVVGEDSSSTLSAYIILPPVLRLICSISNHSDQTAEIHNISVMYNTTKRIGRGGNGTIVNE